MGDKAWSGPPESAPVPNLDSGRSLTTLPWSPFLRPCDRVGAKGLAPIRSSGANPPATRATRPGQEESKSYVGSDGHREIDRSRGGGGADRRRGRAYGRKADPRQTPVRQACQGAGEAAGEASGARQAAAQAARAGLHPSAGGGGGTRSGRASTPAQPRAGGDP